ncbi:MAG: peptidylprolyl isomerase [Planctomycetota bacterium]
MSLSCPQLLGVLTIALLCGLGPNGSGAWAGASPQETRKGANRQDRKPSPLERDTPPERSSKPPFRVVPPTVELPDGVIARVNGSDVKRDSYLEYLFRELSFSRFQGFLDDLLVERKARELGVTIDAERLAAIVDQRTQRLIETSMGGNQQALRETLARGFQTPESYRNWQMQRERPRLLLEECILATRQVTTRDVRNRFEEMYGKQGLDRQIRHIFIRKVGGRISVRDQSQQLEALMTHLRKDSASFGKLVQKYSENDLTRRNDGRIPNYRAGLPGFGSAFDAAVAELKEEGQFVGPVETQRGYHIIQLERISTRRLEEMEAGIRDMLEKEKPSAAERHSFLKNLRKEARIEM